MLLARLRQSTELISVKHPQAQGPSSSLAKEVVADKGYVSDPVRERCRAQGIKPYIPRR